jgi:hypothetical protein
MESKKAGNKKEENRRIFLKNEFFEENRRAIIQHFQTAKKRAISGRP